MQSGKLLIFNVKAAFGMLKLGEVTRATFSYPFSRTSLIGILGAILGRSRNSYWKKDDSLGNIKIALELINPIKHLGFMVNYSHTKYTVNVGGTSGINTYLSTQSGKDFLGFATNVRLDLLRDVFYRIYLYSEDNDLYQEILTRIKDNDYVFPPYLGHANLLVDLEYVGESIFNQNSSQTLKMHSVFSSECIDPNIFKSINANFNILPDIPIRMEVDKKKIVSVQNGNIIIPSEVGSPVNTILTSNSEVFSVKFPKTLDTGINGLEFWDHNEEKNICFLPVFSPKKNSANIGIKN